MEGYRDPFNRRPYPWGREDPEVMAHFLRLGQLRKNFAALRLGDIRFFEAGDKHIGFTRSYEGRTFRIYVNRSGEEWQLSQGKALLSQGLERNTDGSWTLSPIGFCIMEAE